MDERNVLFKSFVAFKRRSLLMIIVYFIVVNIFLRYVYYITVGII